MPLDDEQKQALKTKYREHRRETWRGETSKSKKDKAENSVLLGGFDLDNADEPKRKSTDINDRDADKKIEDTELLEPTMLDNAQRSDSDRYNEVQDALVEKIKKDRQATWADESSSQSVSEDSEERHENSEEEYESENNSDGEKGRITWKLALAVIAGIAAAIGFGVLLGNFLAPRL